MNRDPITDLKEYAVIMACSIFEFLSYITVVLVYKTRVSNTTCAQITECTQSPFEQRFSEHQINHGDATAGATIVTLIAVPLVGITTTYTNKASLLKRGRCYYMN